jgi:hypothetical protein
VRKIRSRQRQIELVEEYGAEYCRYSAPPRWAERVLDKLVEDGEEVTKDSVISALQDKKWYVDPDAGEDD